MISYSFWVFWKIYWAKKSEITYRYIHNQTYFLTRKQIPKKLKVKTQVVFTLSPALGREGKGRGRETETGSTVPYAGFSKSISHGKQHFHWETPSPEVSSLPIGKFKITTKTANPVQQVVCFTAGLLSSASQAYDRRFTPIAIVICSATVVKFPCDTLKLQTDPPPQKKKKKILESSPIALSDHLLAKF